MLKYWPFFTIGGLSRSGGGLGFCSFDICTHTLSGKNSNTFSGRISFLAIGAGLLVEKNAFPLTTYALTAGFAVLGLHVLVEIWKEKGNKCKQQNTFLQ